MEHAARAELLFWRDSLARARWRQGAMTPRRLQRLSCDVDSAEEEELWVLEGGSPRQRPAAPPPPAGAARQIGLETFVDRSANRAGQAGAGVRPQEPYSGKPPGRTGKVWRPSP